MCRNCCFCQLPRVCSTHSLDTNKSVQRNFKRLFCCVAKRPPFRCRLSHAAVEARLELEHGRIDSFACLGMEILPRITERRATPMQHFQDRPPHTTTRRSNAVAHTGEACAASHAHSLLKDLNSVHLRHVVQLRPTLLYVTDRRRQKRRMQNLGSSTTSSRRPKTSC